MPPWVNAGNDIAMGHAWMGVLQEYGVDDASQHGLFALAQSSDWGRAAAYGIMSKLFKKKIEGETLKNPSAFVWSAIRKKWDERDWN